MIAAAVGLALGLAAGPEARAPLPFEPGERTELSVDYLGVKVGLARISVGSPAGELLPLVLQAKTGGLVGFLDVREQLTSNLDRETLLPRTASLEAVELGYRHSDHTRFDREAGTATVVARGKSTTTTTVPVAADTVDFVAMLFRLRTLSLAPGTKHAFTVLAGAKAHAIVAEVVAREQVATRAGTFAAWKVRVPTGFGGKFSERDPTYLWFSDDERRILVRLSTDFAIGRAVANLVSYQPGRAKG